MARHRTTSSRIRKVLTVVGLMCFALLGIGAAFPLWFPWLLKPLSERFGVTYRAYERLGYSRFVLKGVKINQRAAVITADRIEAFTPAAWMWRLYLSGRDESSDYLSAWRWQLQPMERKNETASSTYDWLLQVESLCSTLEQFLPQATCEEGAILMPEAAVSVPKLTWRHGQFNAEAVAPENQQRIALRADMRADPPYELQIDLPDSDARSVLEMLKTTHAYALKGHLDWLTNRIDLSAEFGPQGKLPTHASVRAPGFKFPAGKLMIDGYEDLTGTGNIRWEDGEFELDLSAHADPQWAYAEQLPPMDAVIRARGNTNHVRIETLSLKAPWLNAELSNHVDVSFRGQMLSTQAEIKVWVDLSKQTWLKMQGELAAEAVVKPSGARFPGAGFQVAGSRIEAFGVQADGLDLVGSLEWPWIELGRGEIRFSEKSIAKMNGGLNLTNRWLRNGAVTINGPVLREKVMPFVGFDDLALHVTASGPLTNLTHAGRFSIENVAITNAAPIDIGLQWRGQQFALEQIETTLAAGKTVLHVDGSGQVRNRQAILDLRQISMDRSGSRMFSLREPSRIVVGRLDPGTNWFVDVSSTAIQGPAGAVALTAKVKWPREGQFNSSIDHLQARSFVDLFSKPLPDIGVEHFSLSGGWTNEPITFKLSSVARLRTDEAGEYALHADAHGDPRGVEIERFDVSGGNEIIVSGNGFVPAVIVPSGTAQPLMFRTNQPFRFEAATAPNEGFWNRIAEVAKLGLKAPRIDLRVAGTLHEPSGFAALHIDEIQIKKLRGEQPVPALKDFRANVKLDRNRLQLERLTVSLEDQWIEAHGDLPLGTNYSSWRRAVQWDKATGHVGIDHAEIAKLAVFYPKIVAPQGRLDLDLALLPGLQWQGGLEITDAATRPMLPLGALHGIAARVRFSGQRIEIDRMHALLGGEPVMLSGMVDFQKEFDNGLPAIQLAVRGQNVPLVRSPEVILRSDLDLTISNATNGLPVVSGSATLRDSFFLSDLEDLVPGRVATPKRRPPYFSVEADLLKSWRLKMNVRGDHFLRVRSPLFRGEVSAHLNIEGTLGEPLALGDVRINSGVVQFPFATLRVRQGIVSLMSENPYRPQLLVIAGDRVFGYDIRVEISGPADLPVVEFSSTPGLSSEQVVLLLTTGKLPKEQVGPGRQQRATRIGLFLGKNLLSQFGGGQGTADRLTVRSGENLSEQGKETYSAEYKLSDRWSIVGEYDRFNAFNLGFKWRVYSR